MSRKYYDCIVIGAGHAGAEAAHAAARMGAETALITISRDTIAAMSCNPAIGGLAKGQLAREVDALGGLMALAADATGIQFRLLNRSKGPAVQAPRSQNDKYQYKDFIRTLLEQTPGLTIIEAIAEEILTQENRVCGVRCADGSVYQTPVAVITTGTFLRGLMHIGPEMSAGGRIGEPASTALSESLMRIGIELGRLKTGTPPRLDAKTIDYQKLQVQRGDEDPVPFSFLTERIDREQIPCWITYTNRQVHELLLSNLGCAPLYTGQIKSVGPRYCPSIENKIIRFADKDRHQIFLEPEDREITTIYCNGISTSYPKDIQHQMVRLIPGTENARIVHYAYAIEYDYASPLQLKQDLETRKIAGLFLAGQINGTSGYEEAAAQGIIAGINAVRKLQKKEPVILRRNQAYIGVLIDDLFTKGMDEPYRMFTSRAEYRLLLRADNADQRLTPIGRQIGLVDDRRWKLFKQKQRNIERLKNFLCSTRLQGKSMWELLSRPQSTLAEQIRDERQVRAMNLKRSEIDAVIIEARYQGYLKKQEKLVESFQALESRELAQGLDYGSIPHLRAEAKEKLSRIAPHTLGQASRISGITPADIMVLQIYLKSRS
ncbi:MAG: tRNA uridine-5-carboxymethylaminomethyl(34) synthesis enzyme MnmG [Planctomycetota bacterium]